MKGNREEKRGERGWYCRSQNRQLREFVSEQNKLQNPSSGWDGTKPRDSPPLGQYMVRSTSPYHSRTDHPLSPRSHPQFSPPNWLTLLVLTLQRHSVDASQRYNSAPTSIPRFPPRQCPRCMYWCRCAVVELYQRVRKEVLEELIESSRVKSSLGGGWAVGGS